MAQRVPKGPIYLNVALEHMLHDWTPPAAAREVPTAPTMQARPEDVTPITKLLLDAKNPVIVAEASGRDPKAFAALVELADLLAIPVINGRANAYANFPTDHPLYQGVGKYKAVDGADLVLLVGGRAPWYPARRRPTNGKIVTIHDNPHKGHLTYQNWHSDHYLEGDIATSLKLLAEQARSGKVDAGTVSARRQRWTREHESYVAGLRAEQEKARAGTGIDPVALLGVVGEVLPRDTIFVDETITHSPLLRQHLPQTMPQSFFRGSGGLGQGIGTALGIKLRGARAAGSAADRRRLVHDDDEDRQIVLLGCAERLYDRVVEKRAVADEQHHRPFRRRELDPERSADALAEPAGAAEEALRHVDRQMLAHQTARG